MKKSKIATAVQARSITLIALGVAALIAGGVAIYVVSSFFPIPGVKYLLMAPYLSMVTYLITIRLKGNLGLLKIGLVLALILMLINLFMGLAIVITTFLSELSILPLKNSQRKAFWGSAFFSGYTGLCALGVSKYLIGGVFLQISNYWLLAVGLFCFILGLLGLIFAQKIKQLLPRI